MAEQSNGRFIGGLVLKTLKKAIKVRERPTVIKVSMVFRMGRSAKFMTDEFTSEQL